MEIELIENFVLDYEKLLLTTFESSSYDINMNSLILRKWLLDSRNLNAFNSFLNKGEKIYLNDILVDKTLFYSDYLKNLRVYIPFLVSLSEDVRIDNYTLIDLDFIQKSGQKNQGNIIISPIKLTYNPIEKFIGNQSFIVEGEYFSKKDIIEYVGYVLGAIHYSIKPDKYKKIEKIKKLSFSAGTGGDKMDALILFGPTFNSSKSEKKFTPEKYLYLGGKHEFQTLMILEYSNWVVSSKSAEKLYVLAKEYLVKKSSKYAHHNPDNFISDNKRVYIILNKNIKEEKK